MGASVVNPLGLQKPLVVQSVKGHSTSSSLIILNILWYCTQIGSFIAGDSIAVKQMTQSQVMLADSLKRCKILPAKLLRAETWQPISCSVAFQLNF